VERSDSGKKLLGLRVVRDGGYPIDFGASLIRNLIRVGEWIVGYYILAAISALISRRTNRLGDLAAGTIVVRDARLAVPRDFTRRGEAPAYSPTVYLTGEERGLVKRFSRTARRAAEKSAQRNRRATRGPRAAACL